MLSPEQLGITPKELASLLLTRELIATDKAHYKPNWEATRKPDEPANLFNMAVPMNYSCGTTACIGGWMHVFQQDKVEIDPVTGRYLVDDDRAASDYVENGCSSALIALFYPLQEGHAGNWVGPGNPSSLAYKDITPAAALDAIDNFLATGHPNWIDVLDQHDIKWDREGTREL